MNQFNPDVFLFKLPLYLSIIIDSQIENEFLKLMNFKGQVEEYNPSLKENTSYKIIESPSDKSMYPNTNIKLSYVGLISFKLTCVRTREDAWVFANINVTEDNTDEKVFTIQKIGQIPSIADIEVGQVKDYSKILSKEKLNEFTKALGLVSHGIGIGSFVYLRRIFEYLIEKAYEKAKLQGDWKNEKFPSLKMNEKIESLKNYLPEFLLENRQMYGILSIGVHSLSEDECLEHFDAVRIGIELILDEKLDEYNKNKKIEAAKKKLQITAEKVK